MRRFDVSLTPMCDASDACDGSDASDAASAAVGGGDAADPDKYCAKFEKWLRLRPGWSETGGTGTRIGDEMTFGVVCGVGGCCDVIIVGGS